MPWRKPSICQRLGLSLAVARERPSITFVQDNAKALRNALETTLKISVYWEIHPDADGIVTMLDAPRYVAK